MLSGIVRLPMRLQGGCGKMTVDLPQANRSGEADSRTGVPGNRTH